MSAIQSVMAHTVRDLLVGELNDEEDPDFISHIIQSLLDDSIRFGKI